MRYRPLNSTFFAVSMLGFLISIVYIPTLSETWAFALTIVFLIMIFASFISMQKSSPEPQLGIKNGVRNNSRKRRKR